MRKRVIAILTVVVMLLMAPTNLIYAEEDENLTAFGASPGDITVSATSVNTSFYTYDAGNGGTPENLTINLTVTLTKSGIEEGWIALPYGFFPTSETLPNFTMNEPIFEFLEASITGDEADSIFDGYFNDDASEMLVLYIKDGMDATQQTVAVKFNLNSVYLNRIPNGSPLWSIKLKAYVGETKVYEGSGPSIKSSCSFNTSSGVTYQTPANTVYMDGDVTIRFSHNVTSAAHCELDTDYENIYYIELPTGSTPASNLLSYYDGGSQDMGDGYTRYIKKLMGTVLSGTTMDRSFTPPNMDTGTAFHFRVGHDYKLLNGAPTQGFRDLEYVKADILDWKLYLADHHTSGGANLPRVDITGEKNVATEGTVGWNTYTHQYTSRNEGAMPATGMSFVLCQESTGSPKVAFDKITLCVSREANTYAWSAYKVLFNIKNVRGSFVVNRQYDSGVYLPTSTTTSQNITVTLPKLGLGEYIDEVVVIPMGINSESTGVWPSKNGLGIRYHPTMWSDGAWPDGTVIADHNAIPLSAKIFYDKPLAEGSYESLTHQVNTYNTYYVATNTTAAYATLSATNTTGLAPGDTVQCEIKGFNNSYYGISPWENPRIVVRVPVQLELDSLNNKDLTHVDSGAVYPGIVSVEKLSSSNATYNYYSFQVTGYEVPLKAGDNAVFTIPVTFRVAVGAAPADYYINRILVSNERPGTFRQIQSSSGYYLNNLPAGEIAADYNFSNADNYTARTSSTKFNIRTMSLLTASTAIRGLGTDNRWSDATLVPAQKGETVEMRVVIENKGNTTYGNIRLYDILPKDGDPLGSTGTINFVDVEGPADATIRYSTNTSPLTYGAHSTDGSGPDLQSFSSSGWTTTKPTTPTAVYIDFGAVQILPGESVEVILKFFVPEGADAIAYNQFRYSGKEIGTSNIFNFNSTVSGFSTEAIALAYDANLPDLTIEEVSGMPESSSGSFGIGDNTLTVAADQPKLAGYTFEGWFDNEEGAGDKYDSDDTVKFMSSGSVTLYAKWAPVKVLIHFDKNGGDTDAIPNYFGVNFGAVLTEGDFPTILPTWDGYSFSGWSATSGENNSADFTVGARIESTQPKTAYAVWGRDATLYTLIFDPRGGSITSGEPEQQLIYMDKAIPVTASLANHDFLGWYADLSDESTNWDFAASFMGKASLTLYAKYGPHKYTVTYDGNGADSGLPPVDNAEYSVGDLVAAEDQGTLLKSNHTFKGWSANLNIDQSIVQNINQPAASFTMEAGGLTLYAVWEANPKYTVVYDAGGAAGTAPSDANSPYYADAVVTVLGQGSLSKSSYAFAGWKNDYDNVIYTEGENFEIPSQNVKLTAQWTYKKNGATPPPTDPTDSVDPTDPTDLIDPAESTDPTESSAPDDPASDPTSPISPIPEPPAPSHPGDSLVLNEDGGYIEFDEDGVPLGEWKMSEEGIWIFEEYPPLSSLLNPPLSGVSVPKTGDFLSVIGFAILGLLSAGGVTAILLNRRRDY